LKKQDNESGFGYPIGDDDADTTTNILIFKETDLKTKLVPSNMKSYNIWLNPEASKVMEGLLSGSESLLEGADVAFFLADYSGESTKFHEAYNHSEPDARVKWRVASCKEFEDMKNKGVWEVIPNDKIPEGRRFVKSKWVFQIKRNGIFIARLVACGYIQVPGINFTDTYAPVINNVSFTIILIGMMVWNRKAKIIDIETAFIHGDLEECIFMVGYQVAWKWAMVNVLS
jgi:hypothetical protein